MMDPIKKALANTIALHENERKRLYTADELHKGWHDVATKHGYTQLGSKESLDDLAKHLSNCRG